MRLLLGAVLLTTMAAAASAEPREDLNFGNKMEEFELTPFEARQIYLNSTYITSYLAIGAVFVLLLAVGLYLYDYYAQLRRADQFEGQYYGGQQTAYSGQQYGQAQYQRR